MRTFLFLALFGLSLMAKASDHSRWDGLLKAHVYSDEGGQATWVDYAGFKKDSAQLQAYLDGLSSVTKPTFESWPKDQQLAFLINAYNAWTVKLIVDNYPGLESIRDLGSLLRSPWKRNFIPLFGDTVSLDDIEHGMIRADGVYENPLIHFAVNCASIGCPPLRAEAYTGEQVLAQMQEQTALFLANRTQNRLVKRGLEVSSIFKWYREDFEQGWLGYDSLEQFLLDYKSSLPEHVEAGLQDESLNIRFVDYDWRLNSLENRGK